MKLRPHFLAALIFCCCVGPAFSQGTAFTYQGRLDANGAPATGNYDLTFSLFTSESSSSRIGNSLTNTGVSVAEGAFTVRLDFGAGIFTGPERWLEIGVRTNGSGTFTALSPRQQLTPTPYAVMAHSASNVVGALPPTSVTPIMGMVWVPPGTFIIGSPVTDPDSFDNERPQTAVTLPRGFWMGSHEVTQREYESITGNNPSMFTGDANRPVEQVSWLNATNYCGLLTQVERAAGRIPTNWVYRLPTEAEWEYASRAGPRTTRYAYGDDLSGSALLNYGWTADNSGGTSQPVEQKLPNPWGFTDMHGNVYEWCQDTEYPYPGGSVVDPLGTGPGPTRVIRGGCWCYISSYCRSAQRSYENQASALNIIGFRVVLAPR